MKMPPLEKVDTLIHHWPETESFLRYRNPYELLIAVILSAQCTDAKVNQVTPRLFQYYPEPEALAQAPRDVVERLIFATGFYRDKAAHIQGTARILHDRHGDQVPRTREELTALPGVGRKTANVILGHIFHQPVIIVDTHFKRVVNRLEISLETDPEKIERDLAAWVPPEKQYAFSMSANRHGRAMCTARNPRCLYCPLRDYCPAAVE